MTGIGSVGLRLCAALALLASGAGPGHAREVVRLENNQYRAGTILIRNAERKLYYILNDGAAYRYPVAVGKRGKQWLGSAYIKGKYVAPAWSPPADVKRDKPFLPDVIPGGSPRNPMGPRALVLDRDQYAIHGTNRPGSIGTFASYGCIRMRNADIVDLYERVRVGDKVVVVP
ncbi:L,D-transpeptidase [Hansschlegelia beijingensis]|uniref:Lipoprotein-anchoring transpeptidase ErfK/SrfK n=1 Tax=Hansschlegelia beijingensis TaxID=1133344 RepID=A0A7W6D0X6_9HYPH|nr:L,D-transpeptidase [Hansschlegelia beijingensis]MBB3973854.1 lipoprotein-anchoring transpeptidase ErfK/SrfK [Hansschlegelia beijingensis]